MRHRDPIQRGFRRQGYCLAITVVLLAVASLALIATSRLTVERSILADRQEKELQARWGMLSASESIRSQAARLLDHSETQARKRLTSADYSIAIGTQTIQFRISDEQAKVDVNALASIHSNLSETASRLRQLLTGHPLASRILLRPDTDTVQFPSYGHVFQEPQPSELFNPIERQSHIIPSDLLTCNGTGKLNISRAKDQVIETWLEPVIGKVACSRLLKLRDQPETKSLTSLADGLLVTEASRSRFLNMASLDSSRYSIGLQCGTTMRQMIVDRDGQIITTLEWP